MMPLNDRIQKERAPSLTTTIHHTVRTDDFLAVGPALWHHFFIYTNSCFYASTRSSIMFSHYPSVHSFICYQTCKHNILKINEPLLMPTGTSDPHAKGMNWSMLGVKRSKVKITRGWNRSQKSLSNRHLKNYQTNIIQTSNARITVVLQLGCNRSKFKVTRGSKIKVTRDQN